MGIKNWVRLRAPKASQLDSLAQQKIKSLHPKKATETWFHRSVQRLKKFGVWLSSFRSNLGSKIPGVQLRTRNVVTRNIDNFMTGKGIEAQSSTGVYLKSEDKQFAVEQFGEGAIFEGDRLMELDKESLQTVENEFDAVNKQYTTQVVAFDRKQQTGQLEQGDIDKLDEVSSKFLAVRERYTKATSLAVKLDMSRMNEKLRSATSMQHLLKAQARAMALNPEDFSDSFLVARNNVASFDSAQRDIDRRIVELGENYRRMVYEDVVAFLDTTDGDFSKLVAEQSLRYLVKGTDKLGANTSGVRLPGLDWYVKRATEDQKEHSELSDADIIQKAAAMMYKDWSFFHDPIREQALSIRKDGADGTGTFNPEKMTAYHHTQSYMATLEWLEKLGGTNAEAKIDRAAIRDVTTDYGDELGFGLRVDKAASDAAVLAKYGMGSFDKDYLNEKLPGGMSTAQAPQKADSVTVDEDIVKKQLLLDVASEPVRDTESLLPPYSETPPLGNKSDLDELSGIDFGNPGVLPTVTGQIPGEGGSDNGGSSDNTDQTSILDRAND